VVNGDGVMQLAFSEKGSMSLRSARRWIISAHDREKTQIHPRRRYGTIGEKETFGTRNKKRSGIMTTKEIPTLKIEERRHAIT